MVNLRLKTRLAQEYIQRKLKKVFLTFTKNIKTYLQKIDNQYEYFGDLLFSYCLAST